MKNKFNLSVPIQLWLKHSDYDGNPDHLTTTQMDKPVKEIILTRNFRPQILKQQDISEVIPLRVGDAVHAGVEGVSRLHQEEHPDWIIEKRFYWQMEEFTMSGKPDLVAPKHDFPVFNCSTCNKLIVVDYKVKTSWYAWNIDKVIDGLRRQLSINKYGLYRNNINTDDITTAWVVALLTPSAP